MMETAKSVFWKHLMLSVQSQSFEGENLTRVKKHAHESVVLGLFFYDMSVGNFGQDEVLDQDSSKTLQ